MDLTILTFLTQDGLTTGAIYALVALALVLVFAVTRVILVSQGDFVAFSALTMASFQAGHLPGTLWLLTAGALAVCVKDILVLARHRSLQRIPFVLVMHLTVPALLWVTVSLVDLKTLGAFWKVILTLAIVAPMGPLIYRLIYQPVAKSSVLVLLILSVAMHISLVGIGLWIFGAEGYRTQPFTNASFMLGEVMISAQSLLVLAVAIILIAGLYVFFGHTMYGKALRATAFNSEGAQLVGVPTTMAGSSAFFLASLIGACSGLLIGPITTLYYDSGFLISLKGFVAAIMGGLTSYPLAALGAFMVGLIESYATFFASQYKEVIVFTLVLPFLLWLSLTTNPLDEEH
ncbi:branched-chain amino acid ABC transporter permease [Paenalcaligenes faecalis]|uniref:branched-chain amino acid ABC transporter permease n=1 Tax=Paenalcaligenes faecalis TaxID=2980099 RepID=UPI0022B95CDC|nr:branched-chain amino acid ABC transporter permease [Paenalcaligenes faecalis]